MVSQACAFLGFLISSTWLPSACSQGTQRKGHQLPHRHCKENPEHNPPVIQETNCFSFPLLLHSTAGQELQGSQVLPGAGLLLHSHR